MTKAILSALTAVAIVIGLALPVPHANQAEAKSPLQLLELHH